MTLPGTVTLAKFIFPRLLRWAMKIGIKAFAQIDSQKHGIKTREYMYTHYWAPMMTHCRESPTEVDDPVIGYIYMCQACALCDGTARKHLALARQALAESDPVTALESIHDAEVQLGLS